MGMFLIVYFINFLIMKFIKNTSSMNQNPEKKKDFLGNLWRKLAIWVATVWAWIMFNSCAALNVESNANLETEVQKKSTIGNLANSVKDKVFNIFKNDIESEITKSDSVDDESVIEWYTTNILNNYEYVNSNYSNYTDNYLNSSYSSILGETNLHINNLINMEKWPTISSAETISDLDNVDEIPTIAAAINLENQKESIDNSNLLELDDVLSGIWDAVSINESYENFLWFNEVNIDNSMPYTGLLKEWSIYINNDIVNKNSSNLWVSKDHFFNATVSDELGSLKFLNYLDENGVSIKSNNSFTSIDSFTDSSIDSVADFSLDEKRQLWELSGYIWSISYLCSESQNIQDNVDKLKLFYYTLLSVTSKDVSQYKLSKEIFLENLSLVGVSFENFKQDLINKFVFLRDADIESLDDSDIFLQIDQVREFNESLKDSLVNKVKDNVLTEKEKWTIASLNRESDEVIASNTEDKEFISSVNLEDTSYNLEGRTIIASN